MNLPNPVPPPQQHDLKNLHRTSRTDLERFLLEMGEPAYRLRQISEWVWVKGETSFDRMSNLSHQLVSQLKGRFYLPEAIIKHDHKEISTDGTVKMRFTTEEGYYLESVYIPSSDNGRVRNTLCVSSQIGCSLNCRFCATARMERKRNLFFDEIYSQFRWGQAISLAQSGKPLTNLVFMGMGEPLLNYEQVLQSIFLITDPRNFHFCDDRKFSEKQGKSDSSFSAKRITLSTAGIVAGIRRLADDRIPFELALSLHAADDEKRSRIMMNNPKNNLSEIRKALHYFYQQTGSKITLEYLPLSGFNDGREDAQQLIRFYRQVPAQLVNIIEFNPVPGLEFTKPKADVFSRFISLLESQGVNVRVRRSRGKDISAACGQLANVNKKSS